MIIFIFVEWLKVYDGQVFFGLIVDRKLVSDPSRIIMRFRPELDKLMHIAMLLPSEGPPCSIEAERFLDYALLGLED